MWPPARQSVPGTAAVFCVMSIRLRNVHWPLAVNGMTRVFGGIGFWPRRVRSRMRWMWISGSTVFGAFAVPTVRQIGSVSRDSELVIISISSVRALSGPIGHRAHASRPGVKACTKGGRPEAALAMSRMIRSMAMRMFCCRSASSGSRRNAFWPPAIKP